MLGNGSMFFLTKYTIATNIPTKLSYFHISNDYLLTNTESVMGFTLNHIGNKTGMHVLTGAVNPHNKPAIALSKKVEDVVYSNTKEGAMHYTTPNSRLDAYFIDSDVILGRVNINTQYSAYSKEGIYNHPDVTQLISVLNGHLCKITRLNNGKVRLEHFTHNPPRNSSTFNYISNLDFYNDAKGQYKSTVGVELSENMVMSIVQENIKNQQLRDMVLLDKNSVHTVTEQGLFYFSNNGKRELKFASDVDSITFEYLNKLEENSIFLELLDPLLNK